METNKVTTSQLLARLGTPVQISKFAQFLKDKIEKNKEIDQLLTYAKLIDIDKDGLISMEDLETCFTNLNSN